MKNIKLRFLYLNSLILIFSFICKVQCQNSDYQFIQHNINCIQNETNSINFNHVMKQFNELYEGKRQGIDILHLGDSHIQAGFYSNEIRDEIQKFFIKDSIASYGLLFPFKAALTNNPGDYSLSWTGKWKTCNTVKDFTCSTGIFPIVLKTNDSVATITIKLKDQYAEKNYMFNKVQLFCKNPDSNYTININGDKLTRQKNSTTYELNTEDTFDSLKMALKKNDEDSSYFEFYGLNLNYTKSPLRYHAVGINGGMVKTYLDSPYFLSQLETINPDWIILSLGTNESYNPDFKEKEFQSNLVKLVEQIRAHTDSSWILINTPGDALWKGYYKNANNYRARNIIIETAKNINCSYWDFYKIMGGENSILEWHGCKLASSDKLHLTPKGYKLKGALFFAAFKKLFINYVNNMEN